MARSTAPQHGGVANGDLPGETGSGDAGSPTRRADSHRTFCVFRDGRLGRRTTPHRGRCTTKDGAGAAQDGAPAAASKRNRSIARSGKPCGSSTSGKGRSETTSTAPGSIELRRGSTGSRGVEGSRVCFRVNHAPSPPAVPSSLGSRRGGQRASNGRTQTDVARVMGSMPRVRAGDFVPSNTPLARGRRHEKTGRQENTRGTRGQAFGKGAFVPRDRAAISFPDVLLIHPCFPSCRSGSQCQTKA